MAFYSNTSDTDLANELMLKSPDAYIMKHEIESTGVLTYVTTGDDTLTDATQSMTPDAYISTVGQNLYIVDDNSKLAVGKVKDNAATTITFEHSDMVLVEDGVTIPTFTPGGTYSYRILTPSSQYAYGDFLGYIIDPEFDSTPEVAEFKYSIPRQLIRQDLIENVEAFNFTIASTTNTDVVKELFGMTTYGLQTGQTEYHRGTASFNTSRYQITMNVQDVNSKTILYQAFKTSFRNNGALALGGEDYKAFAVTCQFFRDTLRDSTSVDSWMWRKTT